MKSLKREQGFTLIEIVIVMAIAAALILVVLLAVGGAQRARRDTQRRGDASAYTAALDSYAANNGGVYPATGTGLTATYFSRNDPTTGSPYTVQATVPTSAGQIQYVLSAKCNGNTVQTITPAQSGQYAVVMYMESGGATCYDNSVH